MTETDTTEQPLPEGMDDTGGFVLNGFLYTGAAAKLMLLTSRPQGIRYPDLCKEMGWNRCRTTVAREAKRAGYIIAYKGKGKGKTMHVVPDPKLKGKKPVRQMKPTEAVALRYGLPSDAFTSDGKTRACIWVQEPVYNVALANIEATGLTLQEVLAEAIATYATPRQEKKPVRKLSETLTPVSKLGLGKGIDYDGQFRHVRMPNIEGRREEWLGEHFAKVVTAMREFISKVPPEVQVEHAHKWLLHDPKNTAARRAKLNKARAAFVPLAQQVLAMLEELQQPEGPAMP